MVKILRLHIKNDYCIHIVFDDGVEKTIDFKPFIGADPLTKPLSDPAFFRKVKIYENGRGIYWPNDYDVCPDNLRYHIKSVNSHSKKQSQKSCHTA